MKIKIFKKDDKEKKVIEVEGVDAREYVARGGWEYVEKPDPNLKKKK